MAQISAKFVRNGKKFLGNSVTVSYNFPIALASFPDACKIARLKLLFQKVCKTDPSKYKPISQLPLISKIFEKKIHGHAKNFYETE